MTASQSAPAMALAPMIVARGLCAVSVDTVLHSALASPVRGAGARAARLTPVVRRVVRKSATAGSSLKMAPAAQHCVLATFLVLAIIIPTFSAQPPTADDAIEKDRAARQTATKAGKSVALAPKRGFFGTIFHVILEQINDTKSAYSQISELVNNQFADDNTVTAPPDPSNNGTTETPKITRAEFLRILDRNLKGLNRLRNLEWREAKKDSAANLKAYKDEIFRAKKARNTR